MKRTIIAVIGGGGIYTPELVSLLAEHADVFGSIELRLMDISNERLQTVGGLCERIIAKAAVPIRIIYTDSYDQAVRNADYILIQFRVGGEDARIQDEKLGLKYAIPFVETVTVCGFATFLRTYYELEHLAEAIRNFAPEAWVMNFANPAGMLTEALSRAGLEKVVGVCNASIKFLDHLYSKLKTQNIYINWRGLNHFTFTDRILADGRDVTKSLLLDIQDYEDSSIPFPRELLQKINLFPNQYLQYYFLQRKLIEKLQKQPKVRSEVVKDIDRDLLSTYRTIDEVPELLKKRGGFGYSRIIVNLMKGIETGDHAVHYAVVRNGFVLRDLPEDAFVEVPVITLKNQIIALQVEQLPMVVKGITYSMKLYEQEVIRAAMARDRTGLMNALIMHPLLLDWTISKPLFEEILSRNSSYLPKEILTRNS